MKFIFKYRSVLLWSSTDLPGHEVQQWSFVHHLHDDALHGSSHARGLASVHPIDGGDVLLVCSLHVVCLPAQSGVRFTATTWHSMTSHVWPMASVVTPDTLNATTERNGDNEENNDVTATGEWRRQSRLVEELWRWGARNGAWSNVHAEHILTSFALLCLTMLLMEDIMDHGAERNGFLRVCVLSNINNKFLTGWTQIQCFCLVKNKHYISYQVNLSSVFVFGQK